MDIKKLLNLKIIAFLALLCMPLYLLRISFFSVPTNVFEIIACCWCVWALVSYESFKNEFRRYSDYAPPVLLIIVGLLLSMHSGGSYRSGMGIIKSWFLVPIVFSWLCVLVMDRKAILRALYGAAFLVAIISLGYFIFGKITFDGRLQGIYNSPNFLAMQLVPAIIIGIFLYKENRIWYVLSGSVMLVCLYLTQSYAAWLAIALVLAVSIFHGGKMSAWRKTVVFLSIIFIFFALQIGTSKLDKIIRQEERSSLSSRSMIWSSAIKIGVDNPISGIGPGNFQNKYLEYQKYFPPYLEWAVPQPHNIYLAFWLQAGLLGLAGFLWVCFIAYKEGLREKENLVFLAIISYFLIHGLVDTTYFKNDLAIVFWVAIFCIRKTSSVKAITSKNQESF